MSGNGAQPTYPPSAFNMYTIAFEGSSVAGILFGVYLVIVGTNMYLLQKKKYRLLLWYSIFQLVLTTLLFAFSLYTAPAQLLSLFAIIGTYGPDALSPWPAVIVNVSFVLNTWASDAFLFYRCYVIWAGNKPALVLPVVLYLATVGSSIAWLVVSSAPGAVYSTYAVQITGICYWTCSAAMNVCASCLITVRLWKHRQAISQAVGSQMGGFYVACMVMTLESALLYTVFVIIALVMFTTNNPLENLFFPVLSTVQVIAPSLIIYRIARGISVETDQRGGTSSVLFARSSRGRRETFRRPMRHEVSSGSETMQVMTEHSVKVDRNGSNSFIHEIKDCTV